MANRRSLVDAVAKAAGLDRSTADLAVAGLEREIVRTLAVGEPVRLASLGTLVPKRIAERPARNPQTGEALTAKPTGRVTLRTSASMKAAIALYAPEAPK